MQQNIIEAHLVYKTLLKLRRESRNVLLLNDAPA
jgi:hypothetical protein